MRRDLVPRLDSLTKRDGALAVKLPERWKFAVPEPTRKAPGPGRIYSILTTAVVAAILVNAGVAWTYWRVAGADPRRDGNRMAVEMALPARSDLTVPLAPGRRGDLLVTLINNYDFPVRITSVRPGPGRVMADDEHRDAGCTDPVVELTREQFPVRWEVPRNTLGAFTIPGGLIRAADDEMACEGAVFTIPIQATGAGQGY